MHLTLKQIKKENLLAYLIAFFLSVSVVSFEIISTRVSSVIFVHNYAFIILSLAISGLGCGSIFSFYKLNNVIKENALNVILKFLRFYGFSLGLFIILITSLSVTNHFIFFIFLFIPFFIAGILYSQLFKFYSELSFRVYAFDLIGAATGSLLPLILLNALGASNLILLLSLTIIFISFFIKNFFEKRRTKILLVVLLAFIVLIFINGSRNILNKIPIGKFPEKDFYYVYPEASLQSEIIESRWSIYGRTDFVKYSHQDMVRQLFVDGAAGSQMYRFNGNIKNAGELLFELLLGHTTAIPFLFLDKNQKDSMLIIGPGGGKEILFGLFSEFKNIVGVEINPDFVNIVKKYSNFNGGIYTKFPNVNIFIKEGRHFVKQTNSKFDLLVVALPSTKQLQNIDAFAMNENYLLTVEAVKDYLNILTQEGMMIFTLHNKWELLRFLVTAMKAFEENRISNRNFVTHVVILESEYAPTVVIKKLPFNKDKLIEWKKRQDEFPSRFPKFTFMPLDLNDANNFTSMKSTLINNFLYQVFHSQSTLKDFIKKHPYDITPCYDNKPFFYKASKFLPEEYLLLFVSWSIISSFFLFVVLARLKREYNKNKFLLLKKLLMIFISLGTGFMILEVILFQKLVLFMGTPTISLSVLLCSILLGMGLGSYNGHKIVSNHFKRIFVVGLLIIFYGLILFLLAPIMLNKLLSLNQFTIIFMVFLLLLPLGFLLGIPFPTSIKLLKEEKLENYIPWMYGVNAIFSVFGSIFSMLLAMQYGFNISFFTGLLFYSLIVMVVRKLPKSVYEG